MSTDHRAIVIEQNKLSLYRPNWWPGQIESYPDIIIPDFNPSDWAWLKIPLDADSLEGLAKADFALAGHVHDYMSANGGTITGDLIIGPGHFFEITDHDGTPSDLGIYGGTAGGF